MARKKAAQRAMMRARLIVESAPDEAMKSDTAHICDRPR